MSTTLATSKGLYRDTFTNNASACGRRRRSGGWRAWISTNGRFKDTPTYLVVTVHVLAPHHFHRTHVLARLPLPLLLVLALALALALSGHTSCPVQVHYGIEILLNFP